MTSRREREVILTLLCDDGRLLQINLLQEKDIEAHIMGLRKRGYDEE